MKTLFVSLGCDKNTVDTHRMIGALSGRTSYTLTDDETQAEIIVINTCAFIDAAKQESIGEILSLASLKETGCLKYLVVTGCLAQRYRDEILRQLPEVDAVIGTTAQGELGRVLDELTQGHAPAGAVLDDPDRPVDTQPQRLTLDSHVGYLKIAEGCDKCCTYCAIPLIRGHYRSVPMEQLLDEAKDLARQGARELILVAQETTLYGTDLYGRRMLPELLRRLQLIQGIRWIRVLYCYPEEITDELIRTIRDGGKILPYIDMPIQHCSDRILKRMGRRTNRREIEEIIGRLREEIPGICIRTTLITGFPGETEDEHRELLEFVRRMEFDRLGVYTYSREEDTPAFSFKPQVHPSTKKRRQKELMLAQQKIAFRRAAQQKGEVLEAVIDGRIADALTPDGYVYVGRTGRDIPDVDSCIYIESERDLMTGTFVKVRVTGSRDYDLTGILQEDSEGVQDESAQ